MAVHERLVVNRLRVVRLRQVAPSTVVPRRRRTDPPSAGVTLRPVDLDVDAGSLVVLRRAPLGSALLDCIDGSAAATGSLELAGSAVDRLGSPEHRSLLERTVRRVDLRRPRARTGPTVRDLMTTTARWPTIGPSLPIRPLLDTRLTDLTPRDRALVEVAAALAERADVLLLDAPEDPASDDGSAARVVDGLVGPLRAAVDLEGRTVLAAADAPALVAVADQVLTLVDDP